MTKPTLIGLSGYATAGKDAFADFLVGIFQYKKMRFSDALYEVALFHDPKVKTEWWRVGPLKERLSSVVGRIGWDEAKKFREVREYLQNLGGKYREILGEDVWVNALLPKVKGAIRDGFHVAVTGVRYKNESDALKGMGAYLVNITREGVGPCNSHHSESGEVFGDAHVTVKNDGTLKDLGAVAMSIHDSLQKPKDPILPSIAIQRFEGVRDRCVGAAIEFIAKCQMSTVIPLEDFTVSHEVLASPEILEDGSMLFDVLVDGQVAGSVISDSGHLQVCCHLGKLPYTSTPALPAPADHRNDDEQWLDDGDEWDDECEQWMDDDDDEDSFLL